MKVFLSSVIAGFESYREAAAEAIPVLGHAVVRSEQFAASPASPQIACLQGIRQSDAVVVVLGERYGYVQESGLSATHEEFREARDTKPTLVFIQDGVTPDANQVALIEEARDWGHGSFAAFFTSPEELARSILRAVHDLDLSRATGEVDEGDMLTRALALVPDIRHTTGAPSLAVVLVSGPRQSVLRPAELEDDTLARDLTREALFGPAPIFDSTAGTTPGMSGSSLVLKQPDGWLAIDAEGAIVVVDSLGRSSNRGVGFQPIIHEEVRDSIAQVLRFASAILDRIDAIQRLTHVVPVAAVINGGYGSWLSRAEFATSPSSMPMNIDQSNRPTARLSPPARPRQVLRMQPDQLAEDLTVLLRRAAVR